MEPLWDFLTLKKESLDIIIKFLGLLLGGSSLISLFKWLNHRAWINQVRLDIKVFEIIDDVDFLLPKMYGSDKNNDPLADHNFAYQARDNECDIKSELRQILTKQRYLLIKAPTGYGKTREAGALAKDFMVEGYRVLRITPGWLDIPKDVPPDLNLQRTRVLIMLDDLNGLFRIGNYVQSPKNEGLLFTERSTYAERLVKVLDVFEKLCGQDELRVIATARDEIDEWSVLKYNSNNNLWKRFGTPYLLPRPTPKAMSDFLITSATKCGLLIKQEDIELIVGANQGAYRNIVQNLRRLREEYTIVSKDVFIPTLNGSWKENYEILVEAHPEIKFIYDAIDILQQAHISLYSPIVLRLSLMLWGGDRIRQIGRRSQLEKGMCYLLNQKRIMPCDNELLVPYDGQITERGYSVSWLPFHSGVTYLALLFSDIYKSPMLNSLIDLHSLLLSYMQVEDAKKIQIQIRKLAVN